MAPAAKIAPKDASEAQNEPENARLEPDSIEAHELFDRIVANLAALNLPLTEKMFGSLEQKKGFEWACEILEDDFHQVLDRLLRKEIFAYDRAINYLMGAAELKAQQLHQQVTAPPPEAPGSQPIDYAQCKREYGDLFFREDPALEECP